MQDCHFTVAVVKTPNGGGTPDSGGSDELVVGQILDAAAAAGLHVLTRHAVQLSPHQVETLYGLRAGSGRLDFGPFIQRMTAGPSTVLVMQKQQHAAAAAAAAVRPPTANGGGGIAGAHDDRSTSLGHDDGPSTESSGLHPAEGAPSLPQQELLLQQEEEPPPLQQQQQQQLQQEEEPPPLQQQEEEEQQQEEPQQQQQQQQEEEEEEEEPQQQPATTRAPQLSESAAAAWLALVGPAYAEAVSAEARSKAPEGCLRRRFYGQGLLFYGSPTTAAALGDAQLLLRGKWAVPTLMLAPWQCGVSLRFLQAFAARVPAQLAADGHAPSADAITTTQVVERHVRTQTLQRRCRYLDLRPEVADADVGPPTYFVSHAWQMPFRHMAGLVLRHLACADPNTTFVWLDVFAINQHNAELGQFEHAIGQSVQTLVCLPAPAAVGDRAANPLQRIWCLHELDHSLRRGPERLVFLNPGYSQQKLAALFGAVDAAQAECRDRRDKVRIHNDIAKRHGGLKQFSTGLRLRLLLEPLDCASDVEALAARSGTTSHPGQWDLRPVLVALGVPDASSVGRSRSPPSGPRSHGKREEPQAAAAAAVTAAAAARAVCIVAGAGTGKSTVSAALCKLHPGAIAAAHFIKYDDQRRLDMLRCVKSLAYQLAQRYPALQQYYCSKLSADVIAKLTDAEQAFRLLLLEPLEKLQKEGVFNKSQPLAVLIDALDEADPLEAQLQRASKAAAAGAAAAAVVAPAGNKARHLVCNLLAQLPSFVRFVFTTRPDALGGKLLGSLERAFAGSVVRLEPHQLRRSSADAAVTAQKQQSPRSPRRAAAAAAAFADAGSGGAAPAGQGVVTYHTLIKLLPASARSWTKSCHSKATASVASGPTLDDVYAAYTAIFNAAQQYTQLPGAADARGRLLQALMAAQEPLPLSLLQQMGLQSALQQLPGWGTLFFVADHHVFTLHKSLAEYLLDPGASGRHSVDVSQGHLLLSRHLAGMLDSPSAYSLKYLVCHLSRSPPAHAAPLLDALLQHCGFVEAVFRAGHGHAMVAELSRVASNASSPAATAAAAAAPGSGGGSSWLADGARWLTMWQHVLAASPHKAFQTALMCPTATRVYQAAASSERALQLQGPWRLQHAPQWQQWPPLRATLRGHAGSVSSAVFSPDGRLIASGAHDGAARLWDAASGECLLVLEPPPAAAAARNSGAAAAVTSVSFSYDSQLLAAGSDNGVVHVYDVGSGELAAVLPGHTRCVTSVAFVAVPPAPGVLGLGGRPQVLLATGSKDGTARLWDASTGDCLAALIGHDGIVTSLSFDATGMLLATGSGDACVRLWRVASGRCEATLHVGSFVVGVSLFPDGGRVAAACGDDTVRVLDARSGETLLTVAGHVNRVSGVAVSPDGRLLASSSGDKTLRVWDAATGACRVVLHGTSNWVNSVAWSPDMRQLVAGTGEKACRLFDVQAALQGSSTAAAVAASASDVAGVEGHSSVVTSVAFRCGGGGGQVLASASWDERILLWDRDSGSCVAVLRSDFVKHDKHSDVYSIAFSPNGRLLASGSGDKCLRVWACGSDVNGSGSGSGSWECVAKCGGHTGAVKCVAWSPDGGLIATGSTDHTVRLWERSAGGAGWECRKALLHAHKEAVMSLAFSPSGHQLASGSFDRTVSISDAATGKVLATLPHDAAVGALAFSPDGTLLATGAFAGRLCLYDTRSWSCVATLDEHRRSCNSVAWSPDGLHLVSASDDCTARVWDAAALIRGCQRPAAASALRGSFGGGGGGAAMTADDCTTRYCVAVLQAAAGIRSVAWSSDCIAGGSEDGIVRFWRRQQ